MSGDLITLPIRLSARAATLALRGVEGAVTRAFGIASRFGFGFGGSGSESSTTVVPESESSAQSAPEPSRAAATTQTSTEDRARTDGDTRTDDDTRTDGDEPASGNGADPRSAAAPPEPVRIEVEVEPPAQTDPYAETQPEPEHVSEEPALVEEFAEPGAEDGVGAQVRIDEPWDGYAQMKAKDVIGRVTDASTSAAELAAVGLYERAHQNRQTVLSAVERQLQQLTARGGSST